MMFMFEIICENPLCSFRIWQIQLKIPTGEKIYLVNQDLERNAGFIE